MGNLEAGRPTPEDQPEAGTIVLFLENPKEAELAFLAGLVRNCFLAGGTVIALRVKLDGTYGQRTFDGAGVENLQPYELGKDVLGIARVIKDSEAAVLCPPIKSSVL